MDDDDLTEIDDLVAAMKADDRRKKVRPLVLKLQPDVRAKFDALCKADFNSSATRFFTRMVSEWSELNALRSKLVQQATPNLTPVKNQLPPGSKPPRKMHPWEIEPCAREFELQAKMLAGELTEDEEINEYARLRRTREDKELDAQEALGLLKWQQK